MTDVTDKRASKLRRMPNESRSRRDDNKKEKEKKRKTKKHLKPLYKKPQTADVDLSSSEAEDAEALSFSLTVEGDVARKKAPSNDK
jgi:hypothetical protein